MSHRALSRRLQRLMRNDYYCIAALDHGLSSGDVVGLTRLRDVGRLSQDLHRSGFPAAVINNGALHHVTPPASLSVIAQLVGMPMQSRNDQERAALATPKMAVANGADAIALQVKGSGKIDERLAKQLANITHRAHQLGLPVLLMVNGETWDSLAHYLAVIRSFTELGVDLIKISPGRHLPALVGVRVNEIGAPLLFPGGGLSSDWDERVEMAAMAGYAGICLGRNLFQREDRPFCQQVARFDELFKDAT